MEPLSISASIAGLVSLADLVYRVSTKYVRGFKGARKEVQNLSREIMNLSVVLHNLSLVAFNLEESQSPDDSQETSGLKPQHLHDCQQLLTKLKDSLSTKETQLDSESRLERLQGRLKWPFSSDETKELIQDLQRQKQTIDLALGAESLRKFQELLSRQSDTNERVGKVQLTVDKLLEAQTKIADDKRHNDVLSVFKKASPHREFETNRNLHYDLTGLWLTEGPDFQDWYTTPGSKIWFTGIPGAGKSVLAAAIIEECLRRNTANPRTSLAYFFCTYRDESTHAATSILSSLCVQLAQQDEDAFQKLKEYHDQLTSNRHSSQEPSTEGLIKVLHSMCTVYSRVYLVVDGLDECGDQVATSVRKLVALATSQVSEVISLALLSRDEIIIREILEDRFQNIEIAAHTEDIRLYVASELEQRITRRELRLRDLDLKDQILDRLVDGAKGMARKQALDKLPPTLFATYERILMRIEGYSGNVKQMVQRMLLLISCPSPWTWDTLDIQEMCEVISLADGSDALYEDEIVDEAEVLRWCSSLVRRSAGGLSIEFAHFSVQEYLQGECLKHPILNAYGVSEEKACEAIGSLCIRYLKLKNHERLPEHGEDEIGRIRERREERPFYEYASIYWPHYLYHEAAGEGSSVQQCHGLFQLSKTPSFCTWAIEIMLHCSYLHLADDGMFRRVVDFEEHGEADDSTILAIISAVLRPDFTPLHMAAALWMPNVCRHLLDEGASPSSRSKFGTPLHCAIGGLSVFTKQTESIDTNGFFMEALPPRFARRAARRQTVQLLLEAGSSTHLRFRTPLWASSVSTLSLAVISTDIFYDFDIVADLVEIGIAVLDEDLPYFQDHYHERMQYADTVSDGRFDGESGFIKLLDITGDQKTMGTPESRLYSETLTFVVEVGIKAPRQLLYPTDHTTAEELSEFLETWIEENDVHELERFLETDQSGFVRSCRFDAFQPGWTALHLATHFESLEVLNVLLDIGLDPNMDAADGTTPVRMCSDGDVLRALLQHGASTLIPDKRNMTIWHGGPGYYLPSHLLNQLVELDERDIALQMVSSKNETPICAALGRKCKESVSILLKFCNSKEFWKSGQSIFRAAVSMDSPAVIQALLDAGVELDGMDIYSGNPLHCLSDDTSIDCVLMLKMLFPLDQRRQEDNKTPLELMLSQSLKGKVNRKIEIFIALLSPSTLSDRGEASALWSFACSEAVPFARDEENQESIDWIGCLFDTLIEHGIAKLYEEETNRSALLPFISEFVDEILFIYEEIQNDSMIAELTNWKWLSHAVKDIGEMTDCWKSAVHERDMVRLLSQAIRNDDLQMISLLLAKGVDMHSDADEFSPLDFACFPNVDIGEPAFEFLVARAKLEQVALGVHYTAGLDCGGEGSVSKLRQLLQLGIDYNLPVSEEYGTPLNHHIDQGATNTAEVLLDAGADPWITGPDSFDAALRAVYRGHVSILAKIFNDDTRTPHWDRTWTESFDIKWFAGGNALHLSALMEGTECLEFYLDHKLLCDLEAIDNDLETPMHYAARCDSRSVIRVLSASGGDINAKNRQGLTPLHLAVRQQKLGAVQTLVELGAKHQACYAGATPLIYAYTGGNSAIIEELQKFFDAGTDNDATPTSPRVVRQLAEVFKGAILRSDNAACKSILTLGCPVDIELRDPERVTPLALAIYRQKDFGTIRLLLENGATVSTMFPKPYVGYFNNAIEVVLAAPANNSLLPSLLTKCLEEDADFLEMRRSPLATAIDYGNVEGFGILLDWLRDTYGSKDNLTSSDVESIKRLVENGANLGDMNGYNDTPLHVAAAFGSLEVVKCLLEYGARPDVLSETDCTPLMVACSYARWEVMETLAQYYQTGTETDCAGRSLLHILIQYTGAEDATPNDRIFHQCLDKEVDLHRVNAFGWSAIHGLLISPTVFYLRSLVNRDIRLLQPQWMAPWSDKVFGVNARAIDTLSKRFRWLSPFMTKDDMYHLSGLESPGNHSLLCRAACWGSTEAIENFIESGVDDLEHRCDEHGTPLNAAVLRLRNEAVKTLVRHGAQVPYQLSSPRDPKISMANPEFVIRQWLFVGRYLERRGITDGTADDTARVGGWAGPRTAQVALKWEWRKASDETMLEYASRRQKVLRNLRGRIVKPIGWVEKVCDWRSGDNSCGEEVQPVMLSGPVVVPLTQWPEKMIF
ncbi:ankyrin repeat [Fusarium albosuccineum]|uniref:Ankyrin repeat n=1 Tax=Fusarium albosuccineum TaxID=1237068 RepID=A0A8H4L1I6_9HYPO|nr:ankyrin repeat [Fusarium albosuccineum]